MEYSKSAILLGAEVFQFTKTLVSFPDTEGAITFSVEKTQENFSELLKSELPFKVNGSWYETDILFSAIERPG